MRDDLLPQRLYSGDTTPGLAGCGAHDRLEPCSQLNPGVLDLGRSGFQRSCHRISLARGGDVRRRESWSDHGIKLLIVPALVKRRDYTLQLRDPLGKMDAARAAQRGK